MGGSMKASLSMPFLLWWVTVSSLQCRFGCKEKGFCFRKQNSKSDRSPPPPINFYFPVGKTMVNLESGLETDKNYRSGQTIDFVEFFFFRAQHKHWLKATCLHMCQKYSAEFDIWQYLYRHLLPKLLRERPWEELKARQFVHIVRVLYKSS